MSNIILIYPVKIRCKGPILGPYDDFSPRKLGQRHYLKDLCPKNHYEVLGDHHNIQMYFASAHQLSLLL